LSYPDSVRYLYALGNELRSGAKFGIERVRTLLTELGNPEHGKRFVHVAGTNGKGSTCAMIASMLRESGSRTGLFTSPHLIEPTERIQINGCAITHAEFAAAFEVVHAAAERLLKQDRIDAHPSYFETITAMALVIFRDRCDISVLEVGLGGRLDATNVVMPALCVITQIAFDHEAFLGNTLEAIASEKAGIIKPGVPVVISPQLPQAERVMSDRAAELGCNLIRTPHASELSATAFGSTFSIDGVPYECPLPGRHQVENAITAITACRELGVSTNAIQAGLKKAQWPGRLEFISRNPDFVLDGAHNPAGVLRASPSLDGLRRHARQGRRRDHRALVSTCGPFNCDRTRLPESASCRGNSRRARSSKHVRHPQC